MKTLNKLALTAGLATTASQVLAHPGHDHSHWLSTMVHIGFYGAMILGGVLGAIALTKLLKEKGEDTHEDQSS